MVKNIESVIDYFIYKSNSSKKKDLSNLKLQKLLYYSQAWSLTLYEQKLFKEKIEAWVHGPAIPTVYKNYKQFGYNPILKKVKPADFSELSEDQIKLLDAIWKVYGKYDAFYLEALTHNEEPWQKARKGLQATEVSTNSISISDMKKYYGEKEKAGR